MAAPARAHGLTVATRDTADVEGAEGTVLHPFLV
jgi:predicted nucleic acid-binding protein